MLHGMHAALIGIKNQIKLFLSPKERTFTPSLAGQ